LTSCSSKGALKKLIITGDDFGLALPVNEAIVEAHQKGVLTTASLMAGEEFFQDAVERAKQAPSLRVGLHLTLVEGHPISDPRQIPDLVDTNGLFSTHLARTGFRFFFHPRIRHQLEIEIRAQFEAFCKTGLILDHVNAHNHMHLHPTVLRLMLKVGKDYGLSAVRLPNEPPWKSSKASGKPFGPRFASWMFLWPWITLMRRILDRARIRYNDFFFGMGDSGAMTENLVLRIINSLTDGITEICFHPATRRSKEIDQSMPNYRHVDEFMALTNESILQAAGAGYIQRTTFSNL
jgi:hopanoid biosynthesis associated protein HpnK